MDTEATGHINVKLLDGSYFSRLSSTENPITGNKSASHSRVEKSHRIKNHCQGDRLRDQVSETLNEAKSIDIRIPETSFASCFEVEQ